jgi:hypothetical protein
VKALWLGLLLALPSWAAAAQADAIPANALSFEAVSLSLGPGLTKQGLAMEHAYGNGWAAKTRFEFNLGVNGWKDDQEVMRIKTAFDSALGVELRWRPWQDKGLDGWFAGIGFMKWLNLENTWIDAAQGANVRGEVAGLALNQGFETYLGLGRQWVFRRALLLGCKLELPFYDDAFADGEARVPQLTTLDLDLGVVW